MGSFGGHETENCIVLLIFSENQILTHTLVCGKRRGFKEFSADSCEISFSCRRSESLCRVQGLRLLGLEICRGSLLIVIDVFAGICISCKALRMNPFGIGVRCKSFWHRLACGPADP